MRKHLFVSGRRVPRLRARYANEQEVTYYGMV